MQNIERKKKGALEKGGGVHYYKEANGIYLDRFLNQNLLYKIQQSIF